MGLSKNSKKVFYKFIIIWPILGGLIFFLAGILLYWVFSLFMHINHMQKNIAIWGMTILGIIVGVRSSWVDWLFLKQIVRKNGNPPKRINS